MVIRMAEQAWIGSKPTANGKYRLNLLGHSINRLMALCAQTSLEQWASPEMVQPWPSLDVVKGRTTSERTRALDRDQ